MAATGLHVSLAAEPITYIGDFALTNSMFTSLIVSGLLIVFAVVVRLTLKDTNKPQGFQNFAEWVVESLFNFVHSITGDVRKARLFFPFIATFFLFIILNNWLGLLPGVGTIKKVMKEEVAITQENVGHVAAEQPKEALSQKEIHVTIDDHGNQVISETTNHDQPEEHAVVSEEQSAVSHQPEHHEKHVPIFRPGTADLNTTIALGIISIFMVQFFGVQFLHLSYFSKYFNFSSPIMFFVGILELISEFAKIISFAFRLFGNVFAGEVLISVVMYLAGFGVPIPFYGLEVFVGFVQALVFSMLSLVFFNMATQGHSEH